jgi:hypothetical protein
MKPESAQELTQEQVLEVAGAIPPDHHHCALLAAITIQSALLDWAIKPEKRSLKDRLKSKFKRR